MNNKLKHLAPYLPYKLKAEMIDYKIDYVGRQYDEIIGLHQWDKSGTLWCVFTDGGSKPSLNDIKPILKSLSKLTNEELIPIGLFIRDIEKNKATYKDNIFAVEDAKAWIMGGMKPVLSLNQIMCIMEHLYSIHADIFGLIDAGLAVELKD